MLFPFLSRLLRRFLSFSSVYHFCITTTTTTPFLSLSYQFSLSSDEARKKNETGDEAKKRESEQKKKKNVDKEETVAHTRVFHGLMMHGEAKQNRQLTGFLLCLTHTH